MLTSKTFHDEAIAMPPPVSSRSATTAVVRPPAKSIHTRSAPSPASTGRNTDTQSRQRVTSA